MPPGAWPSWLDDNRSYGRGFRPDRVRTTRARTAVLLALGLAGLGAGFVVGAPPALGQVGDGTTSTIGDATSDSVPVETTPPTETVDTPDPDPAPTPDPSSGGEGGDGGGGGGSSGGSGGGGGSGSSGSGYTAPSGSSAGSGAPAAVSTQSQSGSASTRQSQRKEADARGKERKPRTKREAAPKRERDAAVSVADRKRNAPRLESSQGKTLEQAAAASEGDSRGAEARVIALALLLGAAGLAAGAVLTFVPVFGNPRRRSDLRFGLVAMCLALLVGLAIAGIG